MASPGTTTLVLEGPPNAAFLTLVSRPAGPILFAVGDVWLDLSAPLILDSGVLTGGSRVHPQPVPALLPLGLALAWQSALLHGGYLLVSTPAVTVLR